MNKLKEKQKQNKTQCHAKPYSTLIKLLKTDILSPQVIVLSTILHGIKFEY